MGFRRLGIFSLGLASIAIPARATISYQTTQTAFYNEATTIDGLTVSPSLITFSGSNLTEVAGVANDEYLDPTTGIEFLAFNSFGTTHVAFAVTSGVLTTPNSGDVIEVIFPSGIDGFAFNFTTTYTYETLCIDSSTGTFGSCASGGTTVVPPSSVFIGAINEGPLTTLPSLWLHSQSGAANTDLQNFEVGAQAETPEVATMVLIGTGLVAIKFAGSMRRRRELRLAV